MTTPTDFEKLATGLEGFGGAAAAIINVANIMRPPGATPVAAAQSSVTPDYVAAQVAPVIAAVEQSDANHLSRYNAERSDRQHALDLARLDRDALDTKRSTDVLRLEHEISSVERVAQRDTNDVERRAMAEVAAAEQRVQSNLALSDALMAPKISSARTWGILGFVFGMICLALLLFGGLKGLQKNHEQDVTTMLVDHESQVRDSSLLNVIDRNGLVDDQRYGEATTFRTQQDALNRSFATGIQSAAQNAARARGAAGANSARLNGMDGRLNGFASDFDNRLGAINGRIDGTDGRVDGLELRNATDDAYDQGRADAEAAAPAPVVDAPFALGYHVGGE
jgi:hypothetical protein